MSRKPGDWNCGSCGDLNFASRSSCRYVASVCARACACAFLVRKHRNTLTFVYLSFVSSCRKCSSPNNSNKQLPGDWKCGSCGDINFASRAVCRCANLRDDRRVRVQEEEKDTRDTRDSGVIQRGKRQITEKEENKDEERR